MKSLKVAGEVINCVKKRACVCVCVCVCVGWRNRYSRLFMCVQEAAKSRAASKTGLAECNLLTSNKKKVNKQTTIKSIQAQKQKQIRAVKEKKKFIVNVKYIIKWICSLQRQPTQYARHINATNCIFTQTNAPYSGRPFRNALKINGIFDISNKSEGHKCQHCNGGADVLIIWGIRRVGQQINRYQVGKLFERIARGWIEIDWVGRGI